MSLRLAISNSRTLLNQVRVQILDLLVDIGNVLLDGLRQLFHIGAWSVVKQRLLLGHYTI